MTGKKATASATASASSFRHNMVSVPKNERQERNGVYVGKIDVAALEKLYETDGNALKYSLDVDDTLEQELSKIEAEKPTP